MTLIERRILEHHMQVICATQGHDLDLDQAYLLFHDSYNAATGQAWTFAKFKQRASGWTFYGTDEGYVALRHQRSGFSKMVGVAGSPFAIKHGLKEIQTAGLPVWGAVDERLARSSRAFGFIQPPAWLIRRMAPMIGPEIFGGIRPVFNSDGSITLDYPDIGPQTKFFIGSKQYYIMVIDKLGSHDLDIPFKTQLVAALKLLVHGRSLLPF